VRQSPSESAQRADSPRLTKLLASASTIGAIWRIRLNRNASKSAACSSTCAQTGKQNPRVTETISPSYCQTWKDCSAALTRASRLRSSHPLWNASAPNEGRYASFRRFAPRSVTIATSLGRRPTTPRYNVDGSRTRDVAGGESACSSAPSTGLFRATGRQCAKSRQLRPPTKHLSSPIDVNCSHSLDGDGT